VSLIATVAVLLAGVWLLLSGEAREYHAFGGVLVALAVAGLVLHALISGRGRRGSVIARQRRGLTGGRGPHAGSAPVTSTGELLRTASLPAAEQARAPQNRRG
jgi:hypothetical protein